MVATAGVLRQNTNINMSLSIHDGVLLFLEVNATSTATVAPRHAAACEAIVLVSSFLLTGP